MRTRFLATLAAVSLLAVFAGATEVGRAATNIQVTSITPSKGPSGSQLLVVINGSGFPVSGQCDGPIIDIMFGALSAFPLEAPSATQVRVVAPAQGPGPVDVVVKNNCDGSSATVKNGYTYLKADIIGGTKPPAGGGYGLFVFGGGSYEQLVTASGCPKATATFWATNAAGQFVTYIPGSTVAVANAPWNALFPDGIPYNTALVGRCV